MANIITRKLILSKHFLYIDSPVPFTLVCNPANGASSDRVDYPSGGWVLDCYKLLAQWDSTFIIDPYTHEPKPLAGSNAQRPVFNMEIEYDQDLVDEVQGNMLISFHDVDLLSVAGVKGQLVQLSDGSATIGTRTLLTGVSQSYVDSLLAMEDTSEKATLLLDYFANKFPGHFARCHYNTPLYEYDDDKWTRNSPYSLFASDTPFGWNNLGEFSPSDFKAFCALCEHCYISSCFFGSSYFLIFSIFAPAPVLDADNSNFWENALFDGICMTALPTISLNRAPFQQYIPPYYLDFVCRMCTSHQFNGCATESALNVISAPLTSNPDVYDVLGIGVSAFAQRPTNQITSMGYNIPFAFRQGYIGAGNFYILRPVVPFSSGVPLLSASTSE